MNHKILVRKYILIVADMIALLAATIMAWGLSETLRYLFFPDVQTMDFDRAIVLMPSLVLIPAVFIILASGFRGHYNLFQPFWDELAEQLVIIAIASLLVIIYFYVIKEQFSRIWLVSTWLLLSILIPVSRLFAKKGMMRMGVWFMPTMIIGSGKNAAESAKAIESEPLLGMQVIALFDPLTNRISYTSFTEAIADGQDVEEILKELNDPYVIIALEPAEYEKYSHLVERLIASQVYVTIIPSMQGVPLFGAQVSHIFRHEVLLLRFQNNLNRSSHLILKRTFDLVIAAILLMLLLPLFAYYSWKIRRDGGDAFFSHQRVGLKGNSFNCYKFRTMAPDADKILDRTLENSVDAKNEWKQNHKLKHDPRITKFGEELRTTSLDELPQLFNVLKGEMSLVGPRPIVKEELARYGDQVNFYLQVKPGMTGLWQISGRNDTDYQQRVNLDAWYVRNWSLWTDIVILIKTIPVLILRRGAY
jgi:Undecaprenyl-phosphate galactose phosphotransferase WbaP